MTYGLLLWKIPHAHDCVILPDHFDIVRSRGMHRLAALWNALTKRTPLNTH
ncbi:hypothetical protein [Pararobbsia silviterrae]|uniref:hypothetical protein n=1 Tax=Pararobbsia silviterrae TaxID=1792498 RepID=UPI001313DEFC|nr:hypothetical protein [Pararobbsia silviterrae]